MAAAAEDSTDAVRRALLVRSHLPDYDGAGDDHELLSSSSSSDSATFLLILSTFVAVCGSYVFGNALGFSSPAESGIIDDLNLSLAQYSFFGSILAIGAMVGAFFSGKTADFIGRRGAMWVSNIICILGWLLIGLGQDSLWLYFGRGILGCGVGLLTYAVPVYIAEITPKNLRGGYTAFNEFVVGCGVSLSYLIGSLISWRIFALSGVIPCLMQILGLFFVPESPRWLVKAGRYVEFEASLRRLRGKNADISQEADEIKDYTVYVEQISSKSFRDMFQPKYARCIIVGVGLMVFQQSGGMKGISFYATTIFESAGVSTKEGNIAASVSKLLMSGMSVVLINSLGRRPLLLYSAAGACLCSLIVAVSFLLIDLQYWVDVTPISVLVGVVMYIGAYELGLASVPWIIMSEVFPINIKGPAGSVANVVSWFGSWAVSYTFNYIFEWSCAGVFLMYSCICGLAVVFIAKLVPETKGRTLEEIQASITGSGGEVRFV